LKIFTKDRATHLTPTSPLNPCSRYLGWSGSQGATLWRNCSGDVVVHGHYFGHVGLCVGLCLTVPPSWLSIFGPGGVVIVFSTST
jgi:hypothetical protein